MHRIRAEFEVVTDRGWTRSSRTGTTLRTTSRQKFRSRDSRSKKVGIKDLQDNAQGVILCKKETELQTILKLIVTLWKQGNVSGVCLENLLIVTMSFPEN